MRPAWPTSPVPGCASRSSMIRENSGSWTRSPPTAAPTKSHRLANLDDVPDPSTYRPPTGTIPVGPGVYKFRDERGRVIYVVKAKSLRQRLNSYFADVAGLHPRTRQMVTSAASVEWTVVRSEVE